jgi:hypothetical protein
VGANLRTERCRRCRAAAAAGGHLLLLLPELEADKDGGTLFLFCFLFPKENKINNTKSNLATEIR